MPVDRRAALRADHDSRPPAIVADTEVVEDRGGLRWVRSESAQVAQLMFADRAQGSVCLTPTWGDLAMLAERAKSLAHLVPRRPLPAVTSHSPGSLVSSRYSALFPVPVLLGAGTGTAASILVLGLGAGAGIALLAHHFPNARFTVVEIDRAVVEISRRHYPFLDWLATGAGRLTIEIGDARDFVDDACGPLFDAIIVDCSAPSGGTPPRLREPPFFAAVRRRLQPGRGVAAVNVLGSYRGNNRARLAECLDALATAGFRHRRCLPVLERTGPFDPTRGTNHLVLAADHPIDPRHASGPWSAVRSFRLYPMLERTRVPVVHRLQARHGDVERTWIVSAAAARALPVEPARLTPFGTVVPLQRRPEIPESMPSLEHEPPGAGWTYERRDLLRYGRWVYAASVEEGAGSEHDGPAVVATTGDAP